MSLSGYFWVFYGRSQRQKDTCCYGLETFPVEAGARKGFDGRICTNETRLCWPAFSKLQHLPVRFLASQQQPRIQGGWRARPCCLKSRCPFEIFGSQSGTGGATGGNPAQLAHGISVALYNTAFGLIIAIPSLIFWRYFRARVDYYLLTLELASERLARHLVSLRKS